MAASDAFYEELVSEVNEIIAELGTTYVVKSGGKYNPETMGVDPSTERGVNGLIADNATALTIGSMGGFQSGDAPSWQGKRILILTADAQIKENESVVVDGVDFPATKIETIKPADVVLLYIVDITR